METPSREKIAQNWLPRYTGMPLEEFEKLILLTNFFAYLHLGHFVLPIARSLVALCSSSPTFR